MFTATSRSLGSRFNAGNNFSKAFRRGQYNRRAVNPGALTAADVGDRFTEPEVYRDQHHPSLAVKVPRKVEQLKRNQKWHRHVSQHGISAAAQMALDRGDSTTLSPTPSPAAEQRFAEEQNAADLGLPSTTTDRRSRRQRLDTGGKLSSFSRKARESFDRDAREREAFAMKFPQPPNAKEYATLLHELQREDQHDTKVDEFHDRLVDEHGLYPTHRMDSYMLDDDGMFPPWVLQLPSLLRDRVKYGKLGITEEDEALRVRLGQLPMDERLKEWNRIKKAKEYRIAKEEMCSPTELRDARRNSKRFHWLQRRRQHRASLIRRLMMRRPDRFEAWPSTSVDYSRRLAVIAQHVEAGVETKGNWPLDEEALAKAKIRKRQLEADRSFLLSTDEKKVVTSTSMNRSVAASLADLDAASAQSDDNKFKRLSRRVFARRVNTIKLGETDEHGRNYRRMARHSNTRQNAFQSIAEMAMAKQLRKEPRIYQKGQRRTATENWPEHTQENTYRAGIPTNRYAT